MRRTILLLLMMAGMHASQAQDKIYTERNKVGDFYYTTYIRLYGDSGFVRTDLRENSVGVDTVVLRGYCRRSGRFYQFVEVVDNEALPRFCLKRSGNKLYHCHISGGYEHGWVTWLLTRGKGLRRIYPDEAMRRFIR